MLFNIATISLVGHSPLFHSKILEHGKAKHFVNVESRWKLVQIDSAVGIPTKLISIGMEGHKNEIRFFETTINHPCVCGERWRGGNAWVSVWNFEPSQTRYFKTNFGASVNDLPNLST
ncbi:hypothetical protein AVEN_270820-1 [Araneus ventricosus]|uniref:Uncharacterized protein n=1 Tax=Araneus ventricosus TaxID=182803 RepID=A0A4Y2JP78_ARAVE|nr:hypothetical protein AVEN_270820-1 [Araneus ventricosus]